MKTTLRFVVAALAAISTTCHVSADDVWITPGTTTGGTGTATDPYKVVSGAHFVSLMSGSTIAPNSAIYLTSGVFPVSNGIPFKAGWKIKGAGQDVTIVRLEANHPARTGDDRKVTILGGDNFGNTDCHVENLTVDCNMQNQVNEFAPIAVGLRGNNLRISRVKVVNWGSNCDLEAFLLSIGQGDGPTTNAVIDECVIGPAARIIHENGSSAISFDSAYGIYGAEARNNFISGIVTGTGVGQPTFFNCFGAYQETHGVRIVNNTVLNGSGTYFNAVYNDTWASKNMEVINNTFMNVLRGIFFVNYNDIHENLRFANNRIHVLDGGVGIIYTGHTSSGAAMTNVFIENNVVTSGGSNSVGLSVSGRFTGIVRNNVFQGGPQGYDVYVPWPSVPTVNFTTARDNVNLSGTQLNIGDDGWFHPEPEETIKFTPGSAGWYRVASAIAWSAGTMSVFSDYHDGATDLEFGWRARQYLPVGSVDLIRQGSYSSIVTKARVVADSGWAHLDIYVTTAGKPLKITARGDVKRKLNATPTLISGTPTYQVEVTF